ncbi:MAG: membrane protein insertion efficiency factor YidD [Candidatus Omnitrophica bacterium]|nr:membrane protein insertion efficiency factor YidD [Candidatus Omnitrophota bacterium]
MRYLKIGAISILKFYRKYLSPMNIQCCRFYPSCSEYTIEAIEKYGIFSGSFKGLKRILRCHPFSQGGYDPVR